MSRPLRLLPEAQAEFDESAAQYEAEREGLGLDFVARVETVLDRIAANPRLYAIERGNVRKALVTRFPFVILYREDAGAITVLAIVHGARDPWVWQSRM